MACEEKCRFLKVHYATQKPQKIQCIEYGKDHVVFPSISVKRPLYRKIDKEEEGVATDWWDIYYITGATNISVSASCTRYFHHQGKYDDSETCSDRCSNCSGEGCCEKRCCVDGWGDNWFSDKKHHIYRDYTTEKGGCWENTTYTECVETGSGLECSSHDKCANCIYRGPFDSYDGSNPDFDVDIEAFIEENADTKTLRLGRPDYHIDNGNHYAYAYSYAVISVDDSYSVTIR